MPLFRKRYPPKSEVKIDQNAADWSVATGVIDGKTAILRSWKPAERLRGHPEFRHQVGVAVPLRAPDERGLPSAAENAQVDRIEDLLLGALCENNDAIFVGTITTSGMKEFVFYTSNPQMVAKKVETVRTSVTTHEVQLNIQDDPDWAVHKEFFSW